MPNIAEPTADEIREFRESEGLSQAALGEALGSSARTIEDWEAGRRKPPAMLRLALAAITARLDPDPAALAKRGDLEARLSETITHLSGLAGVSLADQTDDERFDWAQSMKASAVNTGALWALLNSTPGGGFQDKPRFEIYRDRAGHYRARYRASRLVLFTTEAYINIESARRAVDVVKKHVAGAELHIDADVAMSGHYFTILKNSGGGWRALFKYNAELIFATEPYSQIAGATAIVNHIRSSAALAEVRTI